MSKKVSHSAWKKYMTCPKMYDYHYNERLRPTGTSSALVFGSAIDEALNALLLKTGDPFEVFKQKFAFEDLKDLEWDSRDFDPYIFTVDQLKKINGESESYKAWASMRIKGRMMIEAYITQIYPLIEEVHSVQKELEGRPGVLDAVVTLKGHGKLILDHKTSARPYASDAVKHDTQLALYASAEGFTQAGFVVLVKQVNRNIVKICKKCTFNGSFTKHHTCPQMINGSRCHGKWDESSSPEILVQLLVDTVPEHNKKIVVDSIQDTEKLIDSGHFPRNLGACGKIYGKPCPYIDLCWKGDYTGLEKKKEDK